MPWFKISDDWPRHRKTIKAGKNGRALWVASGTSMASDSTDGLIEGDMLKPYAGLAEVPWKSTTAKLVEVRFWHPSSSVDDCDDCARDIYAINRYRRDNNQDLLVVGPDDLYWHAWAEHQLPRNRLDSPEAKAAADRLRDLKKMRPLCEQIQKRDQSLCRYCGRRVNWLARRGQTYATYDHLDPFCYEPDGGNFLEGVVTACDPCNGRKGRRTPKEWEAAGGLPLRPPGWKMGDPWPPPTWSGFSSDLDPDLEKTKTKPGSPHVHGGTRARLGPGQEGPGPEPGPEPGRAGPGVVGLGGAGPAGAGSGLAGLVSGGAGAGAAPCPDSSTTEPNDASSPAATTATHPSPPGGSSS